MVTPNVRGCWAVHDRYRTCKVREHDDRVLWLAPVFARPPVLIREDATAFLAILYLRAAYQGQWVMLRGPTPCLKRVVRDLEAQERTGVAKPDAAGWVGQRNIVSHSWPYGLDSLVCAI